MTKRKKNDSNDIECLVHDMRTPLSVIKSFLNNVGVSEGEMEDFHGAACRSLNKLFGMLDNYKVSDSISVLKNARENIALIIRNAVNTTNIKASENGTSVEYFGYSELFAVCDAVFIDRVVTNLIVNAIEACCGEGMIQVRLHTRAHDIFIEVIDNGCGIEETNLQKIFERGFTSGKKDGTGLGLDICKQMVERSGGRIDVYSKKGNGSVFTVHLPNVLAVNSHPTLTKFTHANRIVYGREDTLDTLE